MKRIVSLLIILVMVLSLGACASEGAQLYEKYASIIDQLEMKNYSGAIHEITQMAMAEKMEGQEKTPVVEILANTWTTRGEKGPKTLTFTTDGNLTVDGKAMTWTTDKGELTTDMQLQIFEEGNHRYFAWFNASERYAVPSITLFYAEEVDGYIQQGDQIGTYYNHPMVTMLMNSWNAVSSYEKVVNNFWISKDEVSINSDSYDWEITDGTSQDKLTIHASGKNDVTGEYTMTVSMRGEYPVLTITDDTTGNSGLYYASNYGEDAEWVENRYAEVMNLMTHFEEYGNFYLNDRNYEDEEAVNFLHDQFASFDGYKDSADRLANWDSVWFIRANRYLQRYLNDGYFYAGPEDTHYNDYSGAMDFVHGLFTEIADYPEAAAVLANWNDVMLVRANRILEYYLSGNSLYMDNGRLTDNQHRAYVYAQFKQIEGNAEADAVLARFTVLPQKYTGAKYVTVDNMGNQSNGSTWESFRYDENGQLIYAYGADEMFETYGTTDYLNFYYDAAGVLTEVKIGSNPETNVSGILVPTYDDKGNLVTITATHNDGTRTYTFTYDEAGRRVSAHLDKNVNGGTSKWSIHDYTYTYDDAGKLIQKVYKNYDYTYTTTYTYDDKGFLIQETLVETYMNWNGEEQYRDTTTMTYTNDDQGRPITAERTSDESGFNYKSYTITYNYEDLYFYNAG